MAEFTVLKEYPITDIVYSEEENEFYSQVFNGMAVEGLADAILIAKLLVSVAGTDTTAREQLKITLRNLWKAIFTNLRSIDLVQFKAICRFVKVLGMTDDQTRTALSKPAEILKFDENTLNSILQTSRISPNQDNPTGSPQKVPPPLDQVQSKSTSPGKVVTTTVPAATNRKPIKVGAIYFEPLNPPHFTSQDYENYSQILSKILLTREQEFYSHTDLSELIDAFPTAKPGIKHAIWKLVADQNDQTSPKGVLCLCWLLSLAKLGYRVSASSLPEEWSDYLQSSTNQFYFRSNSSRSIGLSNVSNLSDDLNPEMIDIQHEMRSEMNKNQSLSFTTKKALAHILQEKIKEQKLLQKQLKMVKTMRSDLADQNAEIQTAIESLPQTEEDMDEFLVKVDLYNQYNEGRYEDITAGTNEILGKLPDARPIYPSIEVLEKRNRGLTVIRDKVYSEWKVLSKKVKAHEKRLEEEEEARKAAEVNAEATEGGETSAGDKPPQVS